MKRNSQFHLDDVLFDDFMRGIIEVSRHIKELDPDVVIAPIRGAVPIMDLIYITDPSLHGRQIEYMPASSIIIDTNKVISGWVYNFLREDHAPSELQKIISIDEVLSGHSVVRERKQIRRAMGHYAKDRGMSLDELDKEVIYMSVGIEDLRHQKAGKPMQKPYNGLKEKGFVITVPVKENIAMDKPELCPVKLKPIPGHRFGACLPIMDEFNLSETYMAFLHKFAAKLGVDLRTIDLQRPAQIKHSEKYIPAEYTSLDAYMKHIGKR